MASECCCEDDSDVDGGVVDEDDGYFKMMCSGVSLRCTLSVVSETMKMSKVVLLMKMMIV